MNMKKLCGVLVSSVVFCMTLSGVVAAEELKIGVFDMQKVLRDSRTVADYRQKFTAEIDSKRKVFEGKQIAVRQAEESLARDGKSLADAVRKTREEKLAADRRELKRFGEDLDADIQRLDRDLGQKMRLELSDVITALGTKEKYSCIAERGAAGIFFLSPALDITDRIILAYDKK